LCNTVGITLVSVGVDLLVGPIFSDECVVGLESVLEVFQSLLSDVLQALTGAELVGFVVGHFVVRVGTFEVQSLVGGILEPQVSFVQVLDSERGLVCYLSDRSYKQCGIEVVAIRVS